MLPNENITGVRISPKQTINDVKGTDTNSERRKQKQKDANQERKKDSVQVNLKTKNKKGINLIDEKNTFEPTINYSEKKGKNIDIIIK